MHTMHTMRHRLLPALLLLASGAITAVRPLAAGEVLVPLSGGRAADGTTYATRLWVTNTGAASRRLTYTFLAPSADGTRTAAAGSLAVAPGATVVAAGLAPAAARGALLLSGAPQLLVTARLEAVGPDGGLRAAAASPVLTGHQLAARQSTIVLHGLSNSPRNLTTDLHLVNAARQAAQCTVDAFHFDGSRIGSTLRLTLPPLSVRIFERFLDGLGVADVADIAETRVAVSCDQAFYAYARVYKPGGGELNLMVPTRPLGRPVTAAGPQP
jgi:hypothetical protein